MRGKSYDPTQQRLGTTAHAREKTVNSLVVSEMAISGAEQLLEQISSSKRDAYQGILSQPKVQKLQLKRF